MDNPSATVDRPNVGRPSRPSRSSSRSSSSEDRLSAHATIGVIQGSGPASDAEASRSSTSLI
jgi:hypothetical protein